MRSSSSRSTGSFGYGWPSSEEANKTLCCKVRAYLWAVLRDDRHCWSTNVTCTHTTNLNVPFFSHRCDSLRRLLKLWSIWEYLTSTVLYFTFMCKRFGWKKFYALSNCYTVRINDQLWPSQSSNFILAWHCLSWITFVAATSDFLNALQTGTKTDTPIPEYLRRTRNNRRLDQFDQFWAVILHTRTSEIRYSE